MKVSFVLVCTCAIFSIKKARGSAIGAPFYPLNPEDLSQGEIKELEYWDKYYHRPKRTLGLPLGSAGIIVKLKTAAISGTKMKIVEIARGSLGSSAGTVVGASTGAKNTVGQLAQGAGGKILGSAAALHQLKAALGAEAQKKIGQVAKASVGALTGSVAAASSGVGNAGKSTLGLITGSANAVNQIKSAAFNSLTSKIGVIASGSASKIAGSSAGLNQAAIGAIGGSANAVKQLKTAAVAGFGNKISLIASGSAKTISGASSSLGQASAGSANALNSLKGALLSGFTNKIGQIASGSAGLATAASAGAGNVGKGVTGVLTGSANAINQLKLAAAAEFNKKLLQIASGSAGLATGASAGIHTKVKQVSGDIVTGGVDVANQLKSALVAGTKQKLGQAASGLAGAITGAVGSASAGLGQITRGAISGSIDLFNQVKTGILKEAQKKIGQVISASAGAGGHISRSAGAAIQGSSNAVNQLKSAAILGLQNKIGQIAAGSATAITGASKHTSQGSLSAISESASAINQLKNAFLSQITNKIGQIVLGSAAAVSGASGHALRGTGSAIAGSANAIHQLKSAALSQIKGKIGQFAQGSIAAATGASGHASRGTGSAIAGSANAIHQLKSAAFSQLTGKIGQIGLGSASAAIGASGQLSKGTGSTVTGSARAIHQLKTAAISGAKNKLGQVASGVATASRTIIGGVHQLKATAAEKLHQQVSNLAEASVEISKRSVHGFPQEELQNLHQDLGEVEIDLPKRSESAWSTGSGYGSADIITQLKSAVVSGLKQKIGQVARGSAGALAGASAGFSKGSFGGDSKGYSSHSYEPSPHVTDDGHKSINVWDLKKSVLNTLLQAVKAIKGGVLAIKGQLIKGSGYIVSGGGKLIAASGDKVTSLGKNILSNAVLVHPNKEHYTHSDYGSHSSSYTAPSGPPAVYNAPSSSGAGHGYESHYESPHYDHHNDKAHGSHAGILILRRIPTTHDKYHSSHSHIDESVVPAFKPLSPVGPTFGTVVGKFLSASTSLDPSKPSPFTDSDIHPVHSYDSHNLIAYGAEESHGSLSPPSPPHFEEPRHHFSSPPVSYQAPLIKEHKVAPTLSSSDFSTSFNDFGGHLQPPSPPATNYGTPFEQPFGFQNINDHLGAEASSVNEQKIKLTKGEILDHLEGSATIASSQVQLPKEAPESLHVLKSSVEINEPTLGPPLNINYLQSYRHRSKSELLPSHPASTNDLRNALFFEKDNTLPLDASSAESSVQFSPLKYSRFKKTASKENFSQKLEPSNMLANFLPQKDESFSSGSQEISNELSSQESYMKFLENYHFHKMHPSSSPKYKHPTSKSYSSQQMRILRTQSEHRVRKPSSRPDFSVVKSVSYEITPQGAKRLT